MQEGRLSFAKISITGIPELDRKLKSVELKVAKKVVRKAERKSLKPLAKEAAEKAPQDTGALQKAIKVRSGKRSRNAILMDVRPKSQDQFYGRLQNNGWMAKNRKDQAGVPVPGKHWMEGVFSRRGDEARQDAMKSIWDGIADILEGK